MQETKDSLVEWQTLNRIIIECIKHPDIKIILQTALAEAIKICGLEDGVVYSITAENSLNAKVEIKTSGKAKLDLASSKINIGRNLCATAALQKKPLILWSTDDVLKYSPSELKAGEAFHFHASFPIYLKGKSIGVLCIYSFSDKKPSGLNLKFVETLTALISLVQENIDMNLNFQNKIAELKKEILDRKKAEEETFRRNKQLSELSAFLQNTREEERKELAREIHDELSQQLVALKIDVSMLNKSLANNTRAKEKISNIMTIINDAIHSIRKISSELRPEVTEEIGLPDALDDKVKKFYDATGVKCNLLIDAGFVALPLHVSMNIFRIIQESLNNVTKHAEATEVNLHLKKENKKMVVTINDNGKGFDFDKIKEKNTFGIIGMQERAKMIGGDLQISSHVGKGTVVELKVPIV